VPFNDHYPVRGRDVVCDVHRKRLKIGLKGRPPVLDGETYNEVKTEETFWTIDDKKTLVLNLEKVCMAMAGKFRGWKVGDSSVFLIENFKSRLVDLSTQLSNVQYHSGLQHGRPLRLPFYKNLCLSVLDLL